MHFKSKFPFFSRRSESTPANPTSTSNADALDLLRGRTGPGALNGHRPRGPSQPVETLHGQPPAPRLMGPPPHPAQPLWTPRRHDPVQLRGTPAGPHVKMAVQQFRQASQAQSLPGPRFRPLHLQRYVPQYRYTVMPRFGSPLDALQAMQQVLQQASAGNPTAFEAEIGPYSDQHLGFRVISGLLDRVKDQLDDALMSDCRQLHDCTKQLQADAAGYFGSITPPPRPPLPMLSGDESADEVLRKTLAASRTQGRGRVVVSEAHSAIASKRLLVDNMQALAADGVKALFFEHLPSELHQADLDAFHEATEGAPMPAGLEAAIKRLDDGHMRSMFLPEEMRADHARLTGRYGFRRVIEAAKSAGIGVIAIDCEASYGINPSEGIGGGDASLVKPRLQTMNYLAALTVQEYEASAGSGDWVALVGYQHGNSSEGVPGVAELTGGIALHAQDGERSVRVNVKNHRGKMDADVVLQVPLA